MTERAEELLLPMVEVAVVVLAVVVVVVGGVVVGGMRGIPRPSSLRWGKCSRQRWHSRSCDQKLSIFFQAAILTCLDRGLGVAGLRFRVEKLLNLLKEAAHRLCGFLLVLLESNKYSFAPHKRRKVHTR